MYLNARKTELLARLFEHLAYGYDAAEVRERVGYELLELLDADFFASYVWDDRAQVFADRVAINMDDANLRRYESYYQHHDPITFQLQQRREPTLVTEILAQAELVKTEFFNDFLARDGLYYGVNMYGYDGERNVGDLRIWRGQQRGNFDRDTLELLQVVKPAFAGAMRRLLLGRSNVRLTTREAQIARLVAAGRTDKEIAAALAITFATVRTHVDRLFEKFEVHNRASLCRALLGR